MKAKKRLRRERRKGSRSVVLGVLAVVLIACVIGVLLLVRAAHNRKVAAAKQHAATFTYKCNGDPKSLPCLQQQYQTLTIQKGVPAAFIQLKKIYNTDATVRAYCHQLTHAIGRTEADAVNNVDAAYSQGDNFCWSGYYHGVMESIVVRIGAKNLTAQLPTICAQLKATKPYSFYHYNCVHGLGHGIMDVKDSNLPASLSMCDLLIDSWEQQSCYGGAFMENEMDEINPDHHTAYLKADQPMYPCTDIGTKYKSQCYLMQTSHALRLANNNFSTVFAECDNIEAAFRDNCYQSLGRDASGLSTSNVEQTKDWCMLGTSQSAQTNCFIGALKDFISYFHSDVQANNLCLALTGEVQTTCQTVKQQYYATL
jgi:hypothetical protein